MDDTSVGQSDSKADPAKVAKDGYDALLKGVLMKLFADRQLMVEPSVVDYLTVRMERSLSAAQEMVDTIDTLSLASKRKVTKPLAAEAMRELGLQG